MMLSSSHVDDAVPIVIKSREGTIRLLYDVLCVFPCASFDNNEVMSSTPFTSLVYRPAATSLQ